MLGDMCRGPLLYVVSATAAMGLLMAAVWGASLSMPSEGDGEAVLVSPGGRIQIHLVQDYAAATQVRLTAPDGAADAPSVVYVPSYLPEGVEHADTRMLTPTSPEQLFLDEGGRVLTILQDVSTTQAVKAGSVEAMSADGLHGFLMRGGLGLLRQAS
jgi:hypothetical protein